VVGAEAAVTIDGKPIPFGDPEPTHYSVASPITEDDFMAQVTQLAELLGWQWAHFRPAMTSKGWRTPVSGSLGKGWPDLVLVRARDRRLIFAELKASKMKPTPEQVRVLELLRSLVVVYGGDRASSASMPQIEVYLWHPDDWEQIERTLR